MTTQVTVDELKTIVENIGKQNNVNIIIHDDLDCTNMATIQLSSNPGAYNPDDKCIHTNIKTLHQLVHGDVRMAMMIIYHEIGHFVTYHNIPKEYYHDYTLKVVMINMIQMYIRCAIKDIDIAQMVADINLMYHEHVIEKAADEWAKLDVIEMIRFQFGKMPSKNIPYLDREAFLKFRFTNDELKLVDDVNLLNEDKLEKCANRFFNEVIINKELKKVLIDEEYRTKALMETMDTDIALV